MFKSCFPFTYCITKITKSKILSVNNLDIVMPRYALLECRDNYADFRKFVIKSKIWTKYGWC